MRNKVSGAIAIPKANSEAYLPNRMQSVFLRATPTSTPSNKETRTT
ncbi:MAG: hypothetical protein ACLS8H_03590 [Ruminococcus sp.]